MRSAIRLLTASSVLVSGVVGVTVAALLLTDTARPSIEPSEPRRAQPVDPHLAAMSGAAGRPAGSNAWRLRKPATNRQIEGYPTMPSAVPGARVGLKVSTTARTFRVRAFRLGWYEGGTGRLVWRSRVFTGRQRADAAFAPYSTRTIVAPWRGGLTVDTRGWRPGAYVFKLITGSGWEAHVPYFVRSRSSRGKVALVAPVTTWQAYNDWGGYSLYVGPSTDRRSWAVSFDRPYPPPGAGQMMYGVVPVVVRAERLGVPLAYFTNVDLARRARYLAGARGYVSMGHDEYWTLSMRKSVLEARRSGTNLAFLGANTMYWRIRLEDRATGRRRVVVGYRSDAHLDPMQEIHPARTTARFRDPPGRKPENSLIGMLYECFPVDAPYRVVSPRWWGFNGTKVRRGHEFAHLVGIEADRVYPVATTPRPMRILSHVPYSCRGVGTSAQSVYYSTKSGAGVFAAGTLRWTCALAGRCGEYTLPRRTIRFTRRVTSNVLRQFVAGPVGRRFPARDNVGAFRLPEVNQVPAS